MRPRSLIFALAMVFGFTLCGLLGAAAVFALPGSALIQLISLDADGKDGILVRTVSLPVIGRWNWEVDSLDGKRICGKSGQTIFEDRGKSPVSFPLDGVGCENIGNGERLLRFSVSPLALGIPLRPTVIEALFKAE